MTDSQRTLLHRALMLLAWISALYGVLLIADGEPINDTAGWVFFLVPIVLVVGERVTRGDDEDDDEEESEASDQDDAPTSTPAP